jgi:adenine C2-methylase RlmN of 23S rRNA A2503 and tRNA A37
MCHLTATGQNKPKDTPFEGIMTQARYVLGHWKGLRDDPAKTVHFNFMARGEPLDNRFFTQWKEPEAQTTFSSLGHLAREYGLNPRWLVSTIMPTSLERTLVDIFPLIHPEIYYSLYSMNPEFRRRWLPRAMDPNKALDLLVDWQYHTKKVFKIHFALIKGQNDSPEDAQAIADAVNARNLRVDFALVRYNPPGKKYGEEAEEHTFVRYAHDLQYLTGGRVKTVDRVGPDVAASCGMFIS